MFKKLLILYLFVSSVGFSQSPDEFRKIISTSKSDTIIINARYGIASSFRGTSRLTMFASSGVKL